MSELDISQLAAAWIQRYEIVQRLGDRTPEAEETYRAYLSLDRLTSASPEDAWQVMLRIIEMTDNEFVLENLAAGPLETLLGLYGKTFIERVESRAAVDPKYRWVVGGVWQGRMDDELWGRVQAVLGEQKGPDSNGADLSP